VGSAIAARALPPQPRNVLAPPSHFPFARPSISATLIVEVASPELQTGDVPQVVREARAAYGKALKRRKTR
jgi:hypothetical protein